MIKIKNKILFLLIVNKIKSEILLINNNCYITKI